MHRVVVPARSTRSAIAILGTSRTRATGGNAPACRLCLKHNTYAHRSRKRRLASSWDALASMYEDWSSRLQRVNSHRVLVMNISYICHQWETYMCYRCPSLSIVIHIPYAYTDRDITLTHWAASHANWDTSSSLPLREVTFKTHVSANKQILQNPRIHISLFPSETPADLCTYVRVCTCYDCVCRCTGSMMSALNQSQERQTKEFSLIQWNDFGSRLDMAGRRSRRCRIHPSRSGGLGFRV